MRLHLTTTGLMLALQLVLTINAAAQESTAGPSVSVSDSVQNVVLITMDGLRWQELFSGPDETLLNKDAGGVRDLATLKQRFWRESPSDRRELLMPFFWSRMATQGIVFGNPEENSKAIVTNGLNFSYPGYSEMLCGLVDPSVDSNEKKNNPNVTVLEWLNNKSDFRGKVAAFCSWDVFPYIINRQRSGLMVNAGWEPLTAALNRHDGNNPQISAARERLRQLDRVAEHMPHVWHNVRYDYLTYRVTQEYVRLYKPRVLYVSLGETDDWAHEGRYDLYLDAAHRNDEYIRELWTLLQSIPEYRNNTTLILTTDHGRGDDRISWKSHGKDIADCQFIWMAVMGPNVNARAQKPEQVTQSQIAATVAAATGHDLRIDIPQAASALPVFHAVSAKQTTR